MLAVAFYVVSSDDVMIFFFIGHSKLLKASWEAAQARQKDPTAAAWQQQLGPSNETKPKNVKEDRRQGSKFQPEQRSGTVRQLEYVMMK